MAPWSSTSSGTPYVIGGSDASGNPTATVFKGTIDSGVLTGWTDAAINLPVPLTDAAGVSTANGLYVFGGATTGNTLSAATYLTTLTDDRHAQAPGVAGDDGSAAA